MQDDLVKSREIFAKNLDVTVTEVLPMLLYRFKRVQHHLNGPVGHIGRRKKKEDI